MLDQAKWTSWEEENDQATGYGIGLADILVQGDHLHLQDELVAGGHVERVRAI